MLTRRKFLTGAAAGAGGAVVLGGCAMGRPDPLDVVAAGVIPVARVGRVPVDDPDSELWLHSLEIVIEMDGQNIALPHRANPVTETIGVHAIHDGTAIGFRLEWPDDDSNDETVRPRSFRDACAVLIGPGAGDESLRIMGTRDQAVTLLHWKADWERDMDEGVVGVRDIFPNVAVDTYPPLGGDTAEIDPDDYRDAGATQWLPGLHVGNPLSATHRTTCVEKLLAYGFGTAETAPTQDAVGASRRGDSSLRVAVAKPLTAVDAEETALEPGGVGTCAFAVWSGSEGDAGGHKTPSRSALRLDLDA